MPRLQSEGDRPNFGLNRARRSYRLRRATPT